MIDELISTLMPGLDIATATKSQIVLYVGVLAIAAYLSINLLRLVVKIVRGE